MKRMLGILVLALGISAVASTAVAHPRSYWYGGYYGHHYPYGAYYGGYAPYAYRSYYSYRPHYYSYGPSYFYTAPRYSYSYRSYYAPHYYAPHYGGFSYYGPHFGLSIGW